MGWADAYCQQTIPAESAIIWQVCSKYGVTAEDLKAHRRPKTLCKARREVWRRLYLESDLTQTQIARLFNRDHSTVSVGIRRG